jgi:2'-hydroxyisoflavone reductase
MRILVLGGTRFVGRHLVEAASSAGHDVTVFSRGRTPLPWAGVEHLAGDRETGDLAALAGRDWDVCLDVSAYLPQHVRASAALLAGRVARYAFISTASVYAGGDAAPIDEESPLHAVPAGEVPAMTRELYGPLKVACEHEVERSFPGRSLILRPGIVAGPYDPTSRFDWWVARAGRGGDLLAPGSPSSPVQVIDGRDLARFAVGLMAREAAGIFNLTGAPSTFGELLEACIEGTGARARPIWVSEELLLASGAEPFADLPLWMPDSPEVRAFYAISNARARAAGLRLRPLKETALDTWEWLKAVAAGDLPPATPGGFAARGLTPEREAELLAAAGAS